MSRKRLNLVLGLVEGNIDFNPYLVQCRKHLIYIGFRKSTIESYVTLVRSSKTNRPTTEDFAEFREFLHVKISPKARLYNNYSLPLRSITKCGEGM